MLTITTFTVMLMLIGKLKSLPADDKSYLAAFLGVILFFIFTAIDLTVIFTNAYSTLADKWHFMQYLIALHALVSLLLFINVVYNLFK